MASRLAESLYSSKKLNYVVKNYGPDFLSTYVGGALLAASAVFAGTSAPFIAIPAAAGLVSLVNQLDHNSRERELLDFYRNQIAKVQGKKPDDITTDDLRKVAAADGIGGCPNNILRYEVENNDRRRNYTIGFHAAAAGIFGVIVGGVLPLLAGTLALPLGGLGVGLGAVVLFQQIDRAVSDIGKVVFNLGRKSAHECVVEMEDILHRGQKVRPLQVFSLMVAADSALGEQIEKSYGLKFQDLYLSDKYKAVKELGIPRGVLDITRALNSGAMEAEDLVLTVCNHSPATERAQGRAASRAAATRAVGAPDLAWLSQLDDSPLSRNYWRERVGEPGQDNRERVILSESQVSNLLQ